MKKLSVFFLAVIVLFTGINIADRETENLNLIRDDAVNAWGFIQRVLLKSEAYGSASYMDVYRLDNGVSVARDVNENLNGLYEGVPSGKALADEIGAEFLFVAAPEKQREEDIPAGIVDFSSSKYDAAISYLSDLNVSFIDMKSVFESMPGDWYSYFYKSDHHWNNEGAFICAAEISEYIKDSGFNVCRDLTLNDFTIQKYDKTHLGSAGRFSGIYYGGVDDVSLYLPSFETEFEVRYPSSDAVYEGDFETSMVRYEFLDGYSFSRYGHYAYLGEDCDRVEIKNRLFTDGARVVMVKDSYAVPVAGFLSLNVSELDMIDLRYIDDSSAKSYIIEKDPDIIIYLFEPASYGDAKNMVP